MPLKSSFFPFLQRKPEWNERASVRKGVKKEGILGHFLSNAIARHNEISLFLSLHYIPFTPKEISLFLSSLYNI